MPEALKSALREQAEKKGLKGKRKNSFIFGIMNKILEGKRRAADRERKKRIKLRAIRGK